MTSGRTRRIQFSRVRINSPAREDGEDEENLPPAGESSSEEKGCCKRLISFFTSFFSCKKPGYFWINWFAILGHLVNTIVMLAIYLGKNQLALPYTESVTTWDRIGINGTCPPASRELETANNGKFCIGPKQKTFDCGDDVCALDYGALIISFHALSFVFQFAAALTDCCKNGVLGYRYSDMIKDSKNPLRFIEYSISASIMLMIIAMINGVVDIHLLFCIAILTASCQLCGLVVEYIDDIYMKWINHLNGWLTFCAAYWCITRAYLASVEYSDASPPEFVYVIVFLLFLLYASFGFVQLLELMCITPRCNMCCKNACCTTSCNDLWCPAPRTEDRCNPYYKEMVFVTLSLGAKMVLGWILFINVLMA